MTSAQGENGQNTLNDEANKIVSDEERFEKLFSQEHLRKTWNQVRKELRSLELRDVIDWLDWVVQIDKTLSMIRGQVIAGEFQPFPPTRYELGKSKGSFRIMTVPNVRDALVYRHICDAILEAAKPNAIKGAYFSRRHAANPVGSLGDMDKDPYENFLEIWLRYQEYRTHTLLSEPYEVLVATDITNYFDSIEHDLLIEYLMPLGMPRKAMALLGRLLEMLKPTAGHSPNPRVGLPVDELDCSRQLAHVFLFEHDQRVVESLGSDGENRYVRWMDDQNIGARSYVEARKVVNSFTRSLQTQRLTLNSGKTKFLSPSEVAQEFHLEINGLLNDWEEKWRKAKYADPKKARNELREIWKLACKSKNHGHWDKVLKRFYAYVVKCRANFLDRDALENLIQYPTLSSRIFLSLVKRDRINELVSLFEGYVSQGESLYEATEAYFFDALLLGELSAKNEGVARGLVEKYLGGKLPGSNRALGKASALLAYYWLGGNVREIENVLGIRDWSRASPQLARSVLACYGAVAGAEFKNFAIKFVGHPSDDVAKMTEFVLAILSGEVGRISNYAHLKKKWPMSGKGYDARAWLTLELLSRSGDKSAKGWLKSEVVRFGKYASSRQEKRVLARIRRRIKP